MSQHGAGPALAAAGRHLTCVYDFIVYTIFSYYSHFFDLSMQNTRFFYFYEIVDNYDFLCYIDAEVMQMSSVKSFHDELEQDVIIGNYGEYLSDPLDAKERLQIVARNIAICRREAGMSQRDVCTVIGCAPQTYSGYEKGKHEPTLETLVRLSHLFNVTLDFLLGKNENNAIISAVEEFENLDQNPTYAQILARLALIEEKMNL